ncbi:hypothetical protein E4U42_003955 [Claviceps africana]|uniref:Uncharacterized protein n=1 Tax=Claviceps africana TaxID=83212 RepID=A0A8K0JC07_9HYPO|nr:hypothetical protein E4U42_003955 [Claviceps africana]
MTPDIVGKDVSIAHIVQQCSDLFQTCLGKTARLSARQLSLIDDQAVRLSSWTFRMDVFSQSRVSLDSRLRVAPTVHRAVVGVLDALSCRLRESYESIQRISLGEPAAKQDVDELDEALKEIANIIALLWDLAVTIRLATKELPNLKVAKDFHIKDEAGENLDPYLQILFLGYIQDRFPQASEAIQNRLASSVLLRRKRILYGRSKYGKDTTKPPQVVPETRSLLPGDRSKIEQQVPLREPSQAPSQNAVPLSAVSTRTRTVTTLASQMYPKADDELSIMSRTHSIAMSDQGADLAFPPPPCTTLHRSYAKLRAEREQHHELHVQSLLDQTSSTSAANGQVLVSDTLDKLRAEATIKLKKALEKDWKDCLAAVEEEITCPYCFHALPVRDGFNERKWKYVNIPCPTSSLTKFMLNRRQKLIKKTGATS